jgi:hypothetical protein
MHGPKYEYFNKGGRKLEKKVDIRADIAKNRLYICVAGFFQDEEAIKNAEKIKEETLKLKPGYDTIVDIRDFKPASPKGVEEMMKVQAFGVQHGMRKAIRVVGDNALAKAQLDRAAKETGLDAGEASSVEEAERILDGQ